MVVRPVAEEGEEEEEVAEVAVVPVASVGEAEAEDVEEVSRRNGFVYGPRRHNNCEVSRQEEGFYGSPRPPQKRHIPHGWRCGAHIVFSSRGKGSSRAN